MFSELFQRFMDKRPIPVMAQALLERVLSPEQIDSIFERTAIEQYTKNLLFSTVFELMSLVVLKRFPSINAAYSEGGKEKYGVSITSIYNKLIGINVDTAAALVRETSRAKEKIIKQLKGAREPLLSGFRIKMLDGNCIEATEHRLGVLRGTRAGALPGKSLVVYEPELDMATDVFPCEDGHAQERSLLGKVLLTVKEMDVWIMDRNFCVRRFLLGICEKGSYFVCREHKGFQWEACGPEKKAGHTDTGIVYEQRVKINDDEGKIKEFRRIRICLHCETRDGEKEVVILTSLPKSVAGTKCIAKLYRKRWNVETMFQELESHLHSEINTLGYPKAALFGFCVALVAYNVLAIVKAALRTQHGEEKIEEELSGYYIAGNVSRTYDGMMVALPEEEWTIFQVMPIDEFADFLRGLAKNVNLSKFKKSKRGPKKPPPKRDKYLNQPHVSTAKLLKGVEPMDKNSP